MKQILWVIIFVVLPLFFYQDSFALDQYMCPKTYRMIQLGQTQPQVITNCGSPSTKQEPQEVMGTKKSTVQQYIYERVAGDYHRFPVRIIVNVKDGKVAGIKIAGEPTEQLTVCNEELIKIGSPVFNLTIACGEPELINDTIQTIPSGMKTREIWIYRFDPYQPALELTFENGQLTSIETK